MDQAAIIHRTSFNERLPWLAGLHTAEEDRAYFRDRVFAECEVWGALFTSLAGFIAFRPGWIDQLYVLPSQQHQGAGRALVEIAKSKSPILRLWTFQRNEVSRRFYERNGFIKIRQTDGRDNQEQEPDVLYEWTGGSQSQPDL